MNRTGQWTAACRQINSANASVSQSRESVRFSVDEMACELRSWRTESMRKYRMPMGKTRRRYFHRKQLQLNRMLLTQACSFISDCLGGSVCHCSERFLIISIVGSSRVLQFAPRQTLSLRAASSMIGSRMGSDRLKCHHSANARTYVL